MKQQQGYIQPIRLRELWFHTGTMCNLQCPFCLEGSRPGDNRIEQMQLADARPFMDEAMRLGVEQFSFTGGEPFVIKDFVNILDYGLELRPCLVLTNATRPLDRRMEEIMGLISKSNPLKFRVSLDYPNPKKHDAGRGQGNFDLSLAALGKLYKHGFQVSIARQRTKDENITKEDRAYRKYLRRAGVPLDTNIVSFPDFYPLGSTAQVPAITEDCMTTYHNEESRANFMCGHTKMILKKKGTMRVYACTLVDDDEDYDLGPRLTESMKTRILLKHHRCYSCFAHGASCSEL